MFLRHLRGPVLIALLLICAAPLSAATHSVAVMPFDNINKDPALDWLSAGIPETVANSLYAIKGLVIVERMQLRKVMDEQKLQLSGFVEEDKAVRVGRLAGAGVLVVGAFQKQGETIRLTARFVDVESGAILKTSQATGKLSDIFDLQDQIVRGLAAGLNIALKEEELAKLSVKPTGSLEAYRHFGQGALLESRKDLPGAARELQKAASIDPGFTLAKNRFIDIFLSLNKGNYWNYEFTLQSTNDRFNRQGASTFRAEGLRTFNGAPALAYVDEGESALTGKKAGSRQLKTADTVYYAKRADGIYELGRESRGTQKSGGDTESTAVYDPPRLVYPYDLQVGKQWISNPSFKIAAGWITAKTSADQRDVATTVTSTETVTVPAGTFDCYVLRTEFTFKGEVSVIFGFGYSGKIANTTWFAPGVGIIKQRMETETGKTKIIRDIALTGYHIGE